MLDLTLGVLYRFYGAIIILLKFIIIMCCNIKLSVLVHLPFYRNCLDTEDSNSKITSLRWPAFAQGTCS